MPYSLIDQRWLPVRRRSGATELIAPWQVTDRYDDDPVVALARTAPIARALPGHPFHRGRGTLA